MRMRFHDWISWLAWMGVGLGVVGGRGESAGAAAEPVSFYREILPVLQANCQGCHQPAKDKGGYVLTDFDKLLSPGESDSLPVVHFKPDESFLVEQITPRQGRAEMPRGQPPLHEIEIELVRRWIAEGAKDDTPRHAKQRYDADHPPVYSRPPVIAALDYSPDGAWIAVGGFHEVLLHHADGSGLAARLVGMSERIQSLRFSADGALLAVAGGQPARLGEIQVWDVARRRLELSVIVGHDTVYGVSWSPDGRLIAFGCRDKTIRAIDATSGQQVLQQMAHEDWVLNTVFSIESTHVISVGRDRSAKLTEVATQRFIDNITSITPGALRGGLQAVARHPHRDEILVGGADGQPQIFQVFRQAARKIGDNAALLRRFPTVEGRIFGVAYAPDGNRIAAAASLDARGAVHLYAAQFDPTIPEALLKAYEKTSGEYTREEREAIERFTTDGASLLHQIEVPGAPVYAVSFSPDGSRVAAGTGAGEILLIDSTGGTVESRFAAAPVTDSGEITAIAPQTAQLALQADPTFAKPASVPATATVAGLEAHPEQVRLTSRNESVQLLISALLNSGDAVDVTRLASIESSAGESFDLVVSPRGEIGFQLRPGHNPNAPVEGRRVLTARFGGAAIDVPVEVELRDTRYEADFLRDVSPVIAKLGCNTGTCHGSQEGKNGFALSLRGYDPVVDVRALTDDLAARRVNLASPDESLMLLKATGVVPHEGGRRTAPGSVDYAVLRQWILEGAKLDVESARVTRIDLHPANPVAQQIGSEQQVRVVATYSDGGTRDVTSHAFVESGNTDVAAADAHGLITTLRRGEAPILARYEGQYAATTLTVMGDRDGFEWQDPPVNNRIDELVAAKWKRLKILPSDLCTDAEFIRRVSLDLIGLPPTADEVREFLANPRDPRSKRDALIERLLNSQDFVEHWANKWADLLQVNRKFLGEPGAQLFRDWIREEIARNTPHDQFVRKLLTASGSTKDNPAAAYWKILRDPSEAMENTTHLFLATRFNCNKCHDHPFERWTQNQYYELAQFFAQVELKKDDASGDRTVAGTAVEGAKPLYEIVSDRAEGGVPHPRTGQPVAPALPYAAGPVDLPPDTARRAELAAWITAPDNRFFALSYVNRLWGYLMGVGLIEPLDDIRAGNPPSNPELLEHLTREFIESGFNTRHILRQIVQSRTYQLALETHRWNEDDQINYSSAQARRLPAEVLLDAVYRVTGATPDFPGATPGTRAAQLLDPTIDLPGGFLANLGRPARESACECERGSDLQLSSIMALLSGPAIAQAVSDPHNALAHLVEHHSDDLRLANELFLRVLGREATQTELPAIRNTISALEQDHARLTEQLARAEADWAARRPQLEQQRLDAIAQAERAFAEYLIERAPRLASAQRERLERIAIAEAAVSEHEPLLEPRLAEWQAALGAERFETLWQPLDPTEVRATGSARLRKLPDGTIRSTGSVGELPDYIATAETTITNITGIKLEVLPDATLPNFGPGLKDGDFALSELVIETASKPDPSKFSRLKIVDGATDRIIPDRQLSQVWNGVAEQGRPEGWSIGDAAGRPHWAAFALENPVGDTNGTVLKFTLQHRYEAPYEIGRFRLWFTTNAVPAAEGLPAPIAAILQVPVKDRNPQQRAALLAHFRSADPDMLRLDFIAELARSPLPDDERLAELETELARATRPVTTDPGLIQLREDAKLSAAQLARKRLTAAQDLTWALINTPSFLFNR